MSTFKFALVALLSIVTACVDAPPAKDEVKEEAVELAPAAPSSSMASQAVSPDNDNGDGCGYLCTSNGITGYRSNGCANMCPGGFANCVVQRPPCP
jgi:hypothetical protein